MRLFCGPDQRSFDEPRAVYDHSIVSGADGVVWIYLVGPLVGSVIAALGAYLLLGPPDAAEPKAATGL